MVFEDPTRKRWLYTVSTFVSMVIGLAVIFGIAIAGIIIIPGLPMYHADGEKAVSAVSASALPVVEAIPPDMTSKWRQEQNSSRPSNLTPISQNLLFLPQPKNDKLVSAYVLQDEANSVKSLEANADKIDIAYPDWFTIKEASCSPEQNINQEIKEIFAASSIYTVPRLTNSDGVNVYSDEFGSIIRSSSLRKCLLANIIPKLKSHNAYGLILDIDGLSEAESDDFLRFVSELSNALHQNNLWLQVVVPAGNRAYNIDVIKNYADFVVIGLNGEHYTTSKSGPIASQPWFTQAFDYFYGLVPHEKIMVGLGSYAYDWNLAEEEPFAKSLTYGQAVALAREAESLPAFEAESLNMVFGYRDRDNNIHAVWMSDGSVIWNQWNYVKDRDIAGMALWRLGSEDEIIWNFAGQKNPDIKPIKKPNPLYSISITGKPEIYRLSNTPNNGEVALVIDADDYIQSARYEKLPSGYELKSVGNTENEKRLVMIIDGGPDPKHTPEFLRLLDSHGIKAVFFVTAKEAQENTELLKSITDKGHLVGNRGGEYVDANTISRQELVDRVNETQKVIQRELLVNTRLYLRQYHSFALPANTADAAHIKDISEMGFFIVRANIDAQDWIAGITADEIRSNIDQGLEETGPGTHFLAIQGQGANSPETIKALESFIPQAKAAGYEFAAIDEAIGVEKKDIMPSLQEEEALFARALQFVAGLGSMIWPIVVVLFVVTTIFSLIRIAFMYYFASRSQKRDKKKGNPKVRWVSVLIPAYNEEQTIGKTLKALQRSHHKRFEALVINDGSTDKTGQIVEKFAESDTRIKLINKENGGKSSALNLGMRIAKYEIVVTIDGDTILQPQTIDEIIIPFQDKEVDAVCGNVEVGNVCNTLTAFQALEYITAQNFDRNALEEVNAINVVPGATGAWKRDKVLEIGGYEDDTLTEDADLTIKMLAEGGKIVYAHNARSYTEAPQTLSALAKQRFRWSFGTFQCLGKHRKLFFKGRVGWISLPNIFVFQIIFPLLAPIGDIVFLIALFTGAYGAIFWGYLFFTAMELISAFYAFHLDKKPKRLLLMAFVQRFYYRQFLYITIIRAIIAILRGKRYGWNKLDRLGTVLEPTS